MNNASAGRFFTGLGRAFIVAAILALIGAWITQLTGETFLGMSQQHFFNDAMTLSLLGIALLLDALLHLKNL